MKMLGWYLSGILTMVLLAATNNPFRTGEDPDLSTAFTYHGQLKSGGNPYSGLADVRLTLWDNAFAGNQIGEDSEFNSVVVEDGLFAVEPDFGPGSFNGTKRWIEVEVRAPSGSGGFLTLEPRQAVNPTPYALYALNGRVGPEGPQGPPGEPFWELDEAGNRLYAVADGIGIGVKDTTAMLEIAGSLDGDASVVLPERSIGESELDGSFSASGYFQFNQICCFLVISIFIIRPSIAIEDGLRADEV